jgi:copper resistance protein C
LFYNRAYYPPKRFYKGKDIFMPRSRKTLLNALLVSLLSFFVAVPAVFAHSVPTKYDPAPNSTVGAPSVLTVHFSEEVEPRYSSLAVSGPDGKPVNQEKSQVSTDKKVITLALPALVPGTYSVHWISVASDDGHRMQGDYKFHVK